MIFPSIPVLNVLCFYKSLTIFNALPKALMHYPLRALTRKLQVGLPDPNWESERYRAQMRLEGLGGALSSPFCQWGCYGAETPRKKFKAFNCV